MTETATDARVDAALAGEGVDGEIEALVAPTRQVRRKEAVQRLQIGFFLLGAMLLMVMFADVVSNRAAQTQEEVVPEAAPTTDPAAEDAGALDPMAEAGVLPDAVAEKKAATEEAEADADAQDRPPAKAPVPKDGPGDNAPAAGE